MKLLIVDDDPDTLLLTCEVIRMAGHECVQAGGGKEALEALSIFPVDGVVMDLGMPGMTGSELLERMPGNMPVVIVTGYPLEDVSHLEILRRVKVLEKPADATAILAAMEELKRAG